MLKTSLMVVTLILLGFAGCARRPVNDIRMSTWSALQEANQYELLSLDPKDPGPSSPGRFHGWRVLGRTTITDPHLRKQLNDSLRAGAREETMPSGCIIQPRHGIRLLRGDKVVDLAICFQCTDVEVFEGEQRSGGFLVSKSPEPVFDQVLRAAGIPRAEKAD
jgi:hypothetical protein